jgi:RHS repeat-associated protein
VSSAVWTGNQTGARTSSGAYHFGARYYNPNDQRWTQLDAIRDISSLTNASGFAYGSGDRSTQSDPSGLVPARDPCQYQPYTHVSRHNDCTGYPYTGHGGGNLAEVICGAKEITQGGSVSYRVAKRVIFRTASNAAAGPVGDAADAACGAYLVLKVFGL